MCFSVFSTAFIIQWMFGLILDFWPRPEGGHEAAGYRVAFSTLLCLQAAAFAWFLWTNRRVG